MSIPQQGDLRCPERRLLKRFVGILAKSFIVKSSSCRPLPSWYFPQGRLISRNAGDLGPWGGGCLWCANPPDARNNSLREWCSSARQRKGRHGEGRVISEEYREADKGEWIGVSCNFRGRSIANERCQDCHEYRGDITGSGGYTSRERPEELPKC